MSVQIQREGFAGIYVARKHPVCQQPYGLTVSCRIQGGLHIGIIGFTDASRNLRPADRALAIFTDGAHALGVRVGAGKTAGALVVYHGVSVFFDRHILQRIDLAAVLHGVVLIEGIARRQQGHGRNVAAYTRISNRREGAAADGDGPTVITEVYIAERAACDCQRTVVEPGTRVR